MKKNVLTKIIACTMALTMLAGTGMSVSAYELGGLSYIPKAYEIREKISGITSREELWYEVNGDMPVDEMKVCGDYYYTTGSTLYYKDEDENATIWFYTGDETDVVIPDELDGHPVKKLMWGVFAYCDTIKTLSIPTGVLSFGNSAVENCPNLEKFFVAEDNPNFTAPDGVLYSKDMKYMLAFPNAKTGTYTVPDGVISVGSSFNELSQISEVILPESIVKLTYGTFAGCEKLEYVKLPDSLPDIGYNTFWRCPNLKEITIPKNIKRIYWGEFSECENLEKIFIPESVERIDNQAFNNCNKLTIYGVKGSYAETYAKENNIPFVCEFTNTSTISADNILFGKTVTVNASADGGNGNYTYAVLYKKNYDKKWTVKQNYSTNDTVTIKPAKATDYQICVKVKDSKGNIVKKFFDLKVNDKLANTSAISSNIIKKGDTVTVKGSATGGNGNYTYAVLYKKKAETKWTVRQGYKDNDEITVRPYTNTDYDICIKVKDSDGTVSKKYFSVKVQ